MRKFLCWTWTIKMRLDFGLAKNVCKFNALVMLPIPAEVACDN